MIKNLIRHLAQVLKPFQFIANFIYIVLLIIEKIINLSLLIFYFISHLNRNGLSLDRKI